MPKMGDPGTGDPIGIVNRIASGRADSGRQLLFVHESAGQGENPCSARRRTGIAGQCGQTVDEAQLVVEVLQVSEVGGRREVQRDPDVGETPRLCGDSSMAGSTSTVPIRSHRGP